jgi:hypothetical protein
MTLDCDYAHVNGRSAMATGTAVRAPIPVTDCRQLRGLGEVESANPSRRSVIGSPTLAQSTRPGGVLNETKVSDPDGSSRLVRLAAVASTFTRY